MMIERKTFERLRDRELPRLLWDATLEECRFVACVFGATAKRPSERRFLRNTTIRNCWAASNCSLGPIVVEDVEVHGLATGGVCIAWGAVYRHVRLSGRCGRLMLTALPSPSPSHSQEKIRLFQEADASFYKNTDWALDISEVDCEELDIRWVPSRLIRRDPDTQIVVRRERLEVMKQTWRNLDLSGTPWANALENILQWRMEDKVLVAPKLAKDFQRWCDGLRLLREAGIAEAD
jgi:hypothetical protein